METDVLEPVIDERDFKAALAAGVTEVNGKRYMTDAKGRLTPIERVDAQDQLEDETVRKVMFFAKALSAQIARFKGHVFEDLSALEALMAAEYGVTKGGPKGNKTFMTMDGCQKVQLKVADTIMFGPQLQVAKVLLDECLSEWAAESRPEIQAIVTRAFNVDREGQINRSEIFMLLRLDIEDPRWMRAMDAIRDAIRVVGSKVYIHFQERDTCGGAWRSITIDLAKA